MKDTIASIVRTFVPVVVGLILSAAATAGIEIPEGSLTVVVDSIFVGGYYVVVRLLEKVSPAFGWFLGLPIAPTYQDPDAGA